MSEETKEIIEKTAVPSFLAPVEGQKQVGAEQTRNYIRPSFLKIVQAMTDQNLKEQFGEGSLISTPENILVCKKDTPVFFVPLLFYTEYRRQYPIDAPEYITERTTNPEDDLAVKARSRRKEDRMFDDGSEATEALNFMILLLNHELSGKSLVLSCSGGSWTEGASLCSLISSRNVSHIVANRFEMQIRLKKFPKINKTSFVPKFSNPSDGNPFSTTDEGKFNEYVKLHEQLAEFQAAGGIEVDYDSNKDSEASNEF